MILHSGDFFDIHPFDHWQPLHKSGKTKVLNEVGRRTKAGGVGIFMVLLAALTIYFLAIQIGAAEGSEWALNNTTGIVANPMAQGLLSVAALVANDLVFGAIVKRVKKRHINPYKNEIRIGTRDFEEAMERAE